MRKELEARAEELFAEYLEEHDQGRGGDPEAFLRRDPEVEPYLRKLLQVHQFLVPSLESRQVGDYLLLERIGGGGMGVVYRAEQLSLGRRVAIKFLPRIEAALDPRSRERFRREMEFLVTLEHPHIVPVFDVGEVDGRPYFVMPLLEGRSLSELLAERREQGAGGVEEGRVVRWMSQIASSLEYIHGKGIVHRDVKPSNIYVSGDGRDALLLDFGLARSLEASTITRTGQSPGTPAYMSPEQVAGDAERIGARTDLYQLAASAYEALTLRLPVGGRDTQAIRQAIPVVPPVPPRKLRPSLSRALETILLRCLSKSPEKRLSSATELVEELERLERGEPIRTRPPSRWESFSLSASQLVRSHPYRVVLLSALVLCAAAALAMYAVGIFDAKARDRDVFEVKYGKAGGYPANHRQIEYVETATRDRIFEELNGTVVATALETSTPLAMVAELDRSNDLLELVYCRDSVLDLVAAASDGQRSDTLWELRESGTDQARKLEALTAAGYHPKLLLPAPGLLEEGVDAALLVLARIREEDPGADTVLLVVDHDGVVAGEYRSEGGLGWNEGLITVCDVDEVGAGDDRPEVLVSGYAKTPGGYLHPVLVALKPDPGATPASEDGFPPCRTTRLDLPITTRHPEVDGVIRSEIEEKARGGAHPFWHGHTVKTDRGRLSRVETEAWVFSYYIDYLPEEGCFHWRTADYGDDLRDPLLELGLDMRDLPFEGEPLEALKSDPAYARTCW